MEGTDEVEEETKEQNALSKFPAGLLTPRVSVFGTVRRLREQRCYMVKKQPQYVFLYTYMDLWIKHELQNNLMLEEVLFDFGMSDNSAAQNNSEEVV